MLSGIKREVAEVRPVMSQAACHTTTRSIHDNYGSFNSAKVRRGLKVKWMASIRLPECSTSHDIRRGKASSAQSKRHRELGPSTSIRVCFFLPNDSSRQHWHRKCVTAVVSDPRPRSGNRCDLRKKGVLRRWIRRFSGLWASLGGYGNPRTAHDPLQKCVG
jgi:hypothetical protein